MKAPNIRATAHLVLKAIHLLAPVQRAARELHTWRQNHLTEEEIKEIYRAQYHQGANYGGTAPTVDWESDEVLKAEHAKAILTVLPVRKVLIGGCSSGMAVIAFRRLGVEAWGFEFSDDLERIVLPEVKPFVRRGSMTDIPFSAADSFEILMSTDVLEHVQIKQMSKMMGEMRRLRVPWMVHMINHIARTPDHMTLKPLSWWEHRFLGIGYKLRRDLRTPVHSNPRIYGLRGDPDHVYTFWERSLTVDARE